MASHQRRPFLCFKRTGFIFKRDIKTWKGNTNHYSRTVYQWRTSCVEASKKAIDRNHADMAIKIRPLVGASGHWERRGLKLEMEEPHEVLNDEHRIGSQAHVTAGNPLRSQHPLSHIYPPMVQYRYSVVHSLKGPLNASNLTPPRQAIRVPSHPQTIHYRKSFTFLASSRTLSTNDSTNSGYFCGSPLINRLPCSTRMPGLSSTSSSCSLPRGALVSVSSLLSPLLITNF